MIRSVELSVSVSEDGVGDLGLLVPVTTPLENAKNKTRSVGHHKAPTEVVVLTSSSSRDFRWREDFSFRVS